MSKEEPKLKNCPFCGSEPKRLEGESEAYCHGQNCPIRLHEMAYTRWNTRPIEDGLVEVLEEIVILAKRGVEAKGLPSAIAIAFDIENMADNALASAKEASHE